MSLQAVVLADVHPSVILVTCLGAPSPLFRTPDSQGVNCLSGMQNVQLRIKPIPKQLTFIPSALTTLVSNMVSFTVST